MHYYRIDFWRPSKWIFEGDFCVRLHQSTSVNMLFLEVVMCPSPLIGEKKQSKTLDELDDPIHAPVEPIQGRRRQR